MKNTEVVNSTRQLVEKDKRFLWHPFTQMRDWLDEDIIIIEEGDGVYLKDTHGNTYIDGVASLWTNVHGHRKREIDEALKDQIDKISHSTFLGLSNVPAVLLAEKLVAITPAGLQKVFYADSGSEAMEVALKVAYQYWCQRKHPEPERTTFVHLTHSYHGDTLGAVSVGGIDLFHTMYKPLLFKTVAAPAPYCYRCPCNQEKNTCGRECLQKLHEIVADCSKTLAGVVIEPLMQGAAGMINQPPGFLREVRAITQKYNTLLICDEVATGFGRTGTMFACEQEQVTPDIMALGKGITGGYLPLSATLFTEEIFDAFLADYSECKSFFHGHTFTGNQLAARAALKNIELFSEERVLESLAAKITILTKRLDSFNQLRQVGDIRQAGFMVGIELAKNCATKKPYSMGEKIGIRVCMEARKRGVIIRPLGNVIVIMPALAIPEKELHTLLDVVYESIQVVTEK